MRRLNAIALAASVVACGQVPLHNCFTRARFWRARAISGREIRTIIRSPSSPRRRS